MGKMRTLRSQGKYEIFRRKPCQPDVAIEWPLVLVKMHEEILVGKGKNITLLLVNCINCDQAIPTTCHRSNN